jgi:hypothetical protein
MGEVSPHLPQARPNCPSNWQPKHNATRAVTQLEFKLTSHEQPIDSAI